MSYFRDIWGDHYSQYNLFQDYYCGIVEAWKEEDWMGIQELMDELSPECQMDIWSRLASNTRSDLKANRVTLEAV